jgi:acyl carrier protein
VRVSAQSISFGTGSTISRLRDTRGCARSPEMSRLEAADPSRQFEVIMSKDELFTKIKEILVSDFEIEAGSITLQAKLYEDLDLDSIDSVDMIVKMKEYVTGKIDPELFKSVRTVQDVVEILHPLV